MPAFCPTTMWASKTGDSGDAESVPCDRSRSGVFGQSNRRPVSIIFVPRPQERQKVCNCLGDHSKYNNQQGYFGNFRLKHNLVLSFRLRVSPPTYCPAKRRVSSRRSIVVDLTEASKKQRRRSAKCISCGRCHQYALWWAIVLCPGLPPAPGATTSPVGLSLPVSCSERVLRLIQREGNKHQLRAALDLQSNWRSWRQSLERTT